MDLMAVLMTIISCNYIVRDMWGDIIFDTRTNPDEKECKSLEKYYGHCEVDALEAEMLDGVAFLGIHIGPR